VAAGRDVTPGGAVALSGSHHSVGSRACCTRKFLPGPEGFT
jgi:hypothetical protein